MSFDIHTFASSNLPNAFNRFPKSLRTQYKSCEEEPVKNEEESVNYTINDKKKHKTFKCVPDCIVMQLRMLVQLVPYHVQQLMQPLN